MRVANVFTDPTTGETYAWEYNHLTEATMQIQRNFTESAPTSLGGLIRQQAAGSPLRFSWSGTALTRTQHRAMLRWWAKCDHYSIFLTDFAGDKFEVMLNDYQPVRKAVALNPRQIGVDASVGNPLWVYDFTLGFEVINFLAGDWAAAGVIP